MSFLEQYQDSLEPLLLETRSIVQLCYEASLPDLPFEPVIRSKQYRSIVAKLQRERTRLSTMQDLVGFRVVVRTVVDQEKLLAHIPHVEGWRRIDRRKNPSHGYRAVHVVRIAEYGAVEVQIRTSLQHEWAELSEHFERNVPGTKYGGGSAEVTEFLDLLSHAIAQIEDRELTLHHDMEQLSRQRSAVVSIIESSRRDVVVE